MPLVRWPSACFWTPGSPPRHVGEGLRGTSWLSDNDLEDPPGTLTTKGGSGTYRARRVRVEGGKVILVSRVTHVLHSSRRVP